MENKKSFGLSWEDAQVTAQWREQESSAVADKPVRRLKSGSLNAIESDTIR